MTPALNYSITTTNLTSLATPDHLGAEAVHSAGAFHPGVRGSTGRGLTTPAWSQVANIVSADRNPAVQEQ